MDLLPMGDFRMIRLFNSSDRVARLTLQVIRDNGMDMKVQRGAYVQSDKYASDADKPGVAAFNDDELARAVTLANNFPDIVLAVSIGCETMVSWSFNPITPEVIAGYVRRARSQIAQPVTSDDNWSLYAEAPKVLIDAIDFAAIHTYTELDTVFATGFFDWKQAAVPAEQRAAAMMDAAVAAARAQHDAVRAALELKGQAVMPIVIGETGWNAVNVGHLGYRAHPVNQKMYYLAMEKWSRETKTAGGPANFIYFEAFDEPWKEGDDKWGLFTVGRKARFVVQGLYPSSLWDVSGYTDADALHWLPISNKKITSDRYTVYAETFVLNEERPWWVANAWDGSATRAEVASASPPDGASSSQITPRPKFWGWGMPFDLKESDLTTNTSADLSDFATGSLNFSIRTTTPGIIEVGFVTGRFTDSSAKEVYMQLAPGEFGYLNDGAWHQVSIPLSVMLARAGGVGDQGQVTNMKEVTTAFVIADRYAKTGKADNSNITTPIHIDAIYWER